jgi:hypothetical protein
MRIGIWFTRRIRILIRNSVANRSEFKISYLSMWMRSCRSLCLLRFPFSETYLFYERNGFCVIAIPYISWSYCHNPDKAGDEVYDAYNMCTDPIETVKNLHTADTVTIGSKSHRWCLSEWAWFGLVQAGRGTRRTRSACRTLTCPTFSTCTARRTTSISASPTCSRTGQSETKMQILGFFMKRKSHVHVK